MDENERPGVVPPGEVPSVVALVVPFGGAADVSRSPSGANEPSEGATGGCTGAGPLLAVVVVTVLPASLNELELLVLREGLVGAAKAKAEPGPPNWVVDMASEARRGFAGWHTRGRRETREPTLEAGKLQAHHRDGENGQSDSLDPLCATLEPYARVGGGLVRPTGCAERRALFAGSTIFSLSLFETSRYRIELCEYMSSTAMPPKQKVEWRFTISVPRGPCESLKLFLVPESARLHRILSPHKMSIMAEYPCIERSIHALSQLNAP